MSNQPAVAARCSQRAYLYLERHSEAPDSARTAFDPDEVTALTGLAPTTAWRRGDPSPRPDRPPRRFSNWTYEQPETCTFDTEEVVTALLDAIEPYATGVAGAWSALGLRAGVMVVIWVRAGRLADGEVILLTPSLSYRERTVQRLARMHLSLDHDQYIDLPEVRGV